MKAVLKSTGGVGVGVEGKEPVLILIYWWQNKFIRAGSSESASLKKLAKVYSF